MISVDKIIAYEQGELDSKGILELFAELIKDGTAWSLQGSVYGRPAQRLIEQGYITKDGKITEKAQELLEQ